MSTIIPLTDVDPALVETLLDTAFEPERRQRTAYKVREGTEYPGRVYPCRSDLKKMVSRPTHLITRTCQLQNPGSVRCQFGW